MIKAVAYYRVDINDNAEIGMNSQKEYVRNFAEKNDYEIVAEVEAIESGHAADRDSLRRVRDKIEKTGSQVILTRCIDRLSRDPAALDKIASNFCGYKIKFADGMDITPIFNEK